MIFMPIKDLSEILSVKAYSEHHPIGRFVILYQNIKIVLWGEHKEGVLYPIFWNSRQQHVVHFLATKGHYCPESRVSQLFSNDTHTHTHTPHITNTYHTHTNTILRSQPLELQVSFRLVDLSTHGIRLLKITCDEMWREVRGGISVFININSLLGQEGTNNIALTDRSSGVCSMTSRSLSSLTL